MKDKSSVSLHSVFKAGYQKKHKQEGALIKQGYTYDKELSNHNQQFYFNPDTKKLITNVSGTHNARDWGTNLMLATGRLKKSKRYKEAHSSYDKARTKYNPTESTVTGHSLGGAIASGIGKGSDKIVTYNKGATIGQKTRKNEASYRTKYDPVSTFAQKTKTLSNKGIDPHAVSNLKHEKISV